MRRMAGGGYDLLHDEPRGSGRYEREEEPRDLVLGIPALLGIFLAVSLVCAVCFGYGYSRGHGPSPAAAKLKPEPQPLGGRPANPDESVSEPALALPAHPKPNPGAAAEASIELPGMPPDASGEPGSRAAAPSPHPAAEPAPVSYAKPAVTPPGSAGTLMVQIAAVSHAADANTLADALRHDGFHAAVRTSTADPLFHVQVGPFPSFEAAKSMKVKLVDSGYNAFIKP